MKSAHIITQEEQYLEDSRVAFREYQTRLKEARQSESWGDRAEYLKLAHEAFQEYLKTYNKYLELVEKQEENKT